MCEICALGFYRERLVCFRKHVRVIERIIAVARGEISDVDKLCPLFVIRRGGVKSMDFDIFLMMGSDFFIVLVMVSMFISFITFLAERWITKKFRRLNRLLLIPIIGYFLFTIRSYYCYMTLAKSLTAFAYWHCFVVFSLSFAITVILDAIILIRLGFQRTRGGL